MSHLRRDTIAAAVMYVDGPAPSFVAPNKREDVWGGGDYPPRTRGR